MIHNLKPYSATKDSGLPWLGDVPQHWDVKRGKVLFDCIDIRSSTGEEELLTVSSDRGVVPRSSATVTMFKAESYLGYKLCWPGDLVINSLWAWARGLGVSRHHGIISSAYGVYRLRPPYTEYAAYIHELVRSTPFNWELQVRSKGIWISRLQLTDESFLGASFPLPPPEEQAVIVRFLNYADRRIWRYIRAKQKLIKLLEEQKQAIMHSAVTRGLDPNVRVKPSGVEWLGDVPEHWEVRRNGQLFAQRNQTGFAELPILEVSLKTGVRVREFDNTIRKQVMSDRDKYKRAAKGDIAYNMMRMWQGAVGVAPVDGLVSPAYVVARPLDGVDVRYFSNLFRTSAYMSEVDNCSRGIVKDRNRLYWEDFKQIRSPYPPPDEQVRIADAINANTHSVNQAIGRTAQEIDLFREYRTRLIADVVTGKLDVREAAARLPVEAEEPEPITEVETAAEESEHGEGVDVDAVPEEAET